MTLTLAALAPDQWPETERIYAAGKKMTRFAWTEEIVAQVAAHHVDSVTRPRRAPA